jgi:FAD/FMN-containing dehydrogenase
LAPDGTAALLLIEVDGTEVAVGQEAALVKTACVRAGATEVLRSTNDDERNELWRVRRELSPSLRTIADLKINHDVVVPRSGIPSLFEFIQQLRERFDLTIACFGHIGDGNIHVNIMVDPKDAKAVSKSRQAELALFTEVVRLEGSISGEHGIGLSKASFISMELSDETISLMKRLKQAFDPNGILNPGKIFPED